MKPTATRSKSIVSGVLIAASLAFTASTAMAAPVHKATTHVAAQTAPQVMYKDIVRPNGQKRSDAVYQADVSACYAQTGGSPYLPDSAAMKKCMLNDGFQFVWQRGFGGSSGRTVASRSGSSDDGYTPPDTSAQDAAGWAAQQSAIDAANQAAQDTAQEANDMAASNAAAAAENAAAEDMINQDTMNQLNNQ